MNFDPKTFWAENELCIGKPFRTDKPRAPIMYWMDDHWLFEEMRLPSTVRYYRDAEYRAAIHRACNDRCEEALGRRFFRETPEPPRVLRIEEVFGAQTIILEGGPPWLEPGVTTPDALRHKLDELEQFSDAELRALIFSTGGVVEAATPNPDGSKPRRVIGSRGPATIATSVMGTMELFYWLEDEPVLLARFFDVLADVLIRYQRILAEAGGYEPCGYSWADDNCALFSPELYQQYCYPMMERVFAAFAPHPSDWRYLHADSDMEHLLPILATLDLKGVNLGPRIPAETIRRALPRTEIFGQVAPFTLRNRGREAIIAEVRRDFAAVGGDGGLTVCTAGSVAAGTSLEAIRTFMWAVQEFCRYDRGGVGTSGKTV